MQNSASGSSGFERTSRYHGRMGGWNSCEAMHTWEWASLPYVLSGLRWVPRMQICTECIHSCPSSLSSRLSPFPLHSVQTLYPGIYYTVIPPFCLFSLKPTHTLWCPSYTLLALNLFMTLRHDIGSSLYHECSVTLSPILEETFQVLSTQVISNSSMKLMTLQ